MSKETSPFYMKMLWGDYTKATGHLGATEHGAYLMLQKHYWCSGRPLPDDDRVLWRIATCDSVDHWMSMRPTIAAFFEVADGHWRHIELEKLMQETISTINKNSKRSRDAARVRWERERQRKEAMLEHVPEQCLSNASQSQSHSQSQSDNNQRECDAPQGVAPRARGSRLSPDWKPTDADIEYATKLGLNVATISEKFRDHWLAATGAKAVKLDWSAAWRIWCRNEIEFASRRPGGATPPPGSRPKFN